jgi:hypothetical protein
MSPEFPLLLQFLDHFWIGTVAVRVDHPGARVTRGKQGVPEKALDSRGITPGSKQEIDGGTGRVDGPVQVCPLALHPSVGLVHPPGSVGRLQFAAATFIQFRRVALDPSPDGGMVSRQASFRKKFLDVAMRARIADTTLPHR